MATVREEQPTPGGQAKGSGPWLVTCAALLALAGVASADGPPADVPGWYRDAFPRFRGCALVAASPVADGAPATTFPYRRFGLLGDADLWIYRSDTCRWRRPDDVRRLQGTPGADLLTRGS